MLNWKNTQYTYVEKVIAIDINLRGDRNKITIPLKHLSSHEDVFHCMEVFE